MNVVDTSRAVEYFRNKVEFSTGPVELKNMLDYGDDIRIIDVRAAEDYAVGHIPGSINLPRDKWETYECLQQEKKNIVYCYSGVCHLASEAGLFFAEHGYPVMELDGGFEEWTKHDFPVER